MRPAASSLNALHTMRSTKSRSRLETTFRRALWARGVRGYRLKSRLPGRPDVVFPRLHLALFVHGCFWHRCPSCAIPWPRANADFWREKLQGNIDRDERVVRELRSLGWQVKVLWEHELRADLDSAATRVAREITRLRTRRERHTDHAVANAS